MKRIVSLSILAVFLLFGCVEKSSERKIAESKVLVPVKELQKKYAPDKRVAIFNVSVVEKGTSLLVRGEVENAEAKKELFAALAAENKELVDSVEVLPAENLGRKNWGIVTVSVANMRSEPKESAELGTQVLMGNIVKLWKRKGGYVYIQSPDKYLGWADTDQMIRVTEQEAEAWSKSKKVFVTAYFDFIRQQPASSSFPVCDVTGGAIMKYLGLNGEWVKVGLADGRTGYIARSSVVDYDQWGNKLQPIADNLERTGKFMLGVPYLWGGTSVKGVDCSGFIKTVYLLNGMMLNRDANQQAEEGVPVEPGKKFANLKKGDLLFFGRKAENGESERIVHVGLYLGNQEYIHSSGKVRINSFDPDSPIFDEYNLKRFVRARRVIASTPQVAEVKIK